MKLTLVIRFAATEPIPDLDIPLTINFDKDDVNTLVNAGWIKNVIRSKVPQSTSNRIRLIYNGRVLNDKTNFRLEVLKPPADPSTEPREQQIYIHCVIGEKLTKQQLAEETQLDNRPQEVSTTTQPIGFDRLLERGFSQEDISDLRRQFMMIHADQFPTNLGSDIHDLEDEEARRHTLRQMEDRWIESTINGDTNNGGEPVPGVPAPSAAGTGEAQQTTPLGDLEGWQDNRDILLGVLLGIFLGVIAVIFIQVDDTVFNKHTRAAIYMGFFINWSLGIIRLGLWT
ncbi:uncharacterized protein CANTADRAFT_21334 [Suhomyces tanzawaensis NRRL Y-17324]|uniref:Ubiquitin-like domain-containing protein n=1 Tax=Suhomyces tanzawaensis NRRL Y-17324 TaxID=984487 RepID=A0A1E4SKV6_9ASCO|nr:uncharacterized protein CANTADRAFT_21334 [Suhomyces tanzawaensis NRRL Y-17324]ODV80077.1 hypothetical protein CANTADRAFT_21334 [Suhomyces tanzawaensis NRRL Y-17324]